MHLQPAKWLDNDWIVIGDDPEGDGCGIPVLTHKKTNVGKSYVDFDYFRVEQTNE